MDEGGKVDRRFGTLLCGRLHVVVGRLGGELVAWPLPRCALGLVLCDLLLEKGVFPAELIVLVLEALGDVLESNIAFDLTLLVGLDTGLQLCELGLLAFSKGTLGGAERKKKSEMEEERKGGTDRF